MARALVFSSVWLTTVFPVTLTSVLSRQGEETGLKTGVELHQQGAEKPFRPSP
jgi:hypothetical protein